MAGVDLRVGMRMQQQSSRGFVRYIGALEGRGDQIWVGIEWDDATRGKHSGSVDGVSYFTTRNEGSGSFIKASKVGKGGRTHFLRAVEQRYIADATDTAHLSQHHEVGGTGGVVEFRVQDRLLPLRKLEFVDVSGLCVAALYDAPGLSHGLGELFVVMRELRVADSLFSSIAVVRNLLSEFPGLQVLDLSGNFLYPEESYVKDSEREQHEGLHTLIMNQCKVAWDGVQGVCARTPNLRELRVYQCEIATLQQSAVFLGTFANLELLDLDQNSVPWGMVVTHLGALPCLNELYLSRNGLIDCDVFYVADVQELALFRKLKTLSLAQNMLDGWQVVTALHGLPALCHLRLAGNKITEDYQTDDTTKQFAGLTSRMQAIGRIGGLQVLDGSKISEDERRYAEKMYAIVVCAEAARRDGLEAAEKEHPRLKELWEHFGLDETTGRAAGRTGMTGSARAGLVEVRMQAGRDVTAGRNSVTRRMPRSVKLERVKRIAERLLRIDDSQVDQIAVDVGNGIEVVKDESREIEFWLGAAGANEVITVVCE